MNTNEAQTIGRNAELADEPRIPFMNSELMAAVKDAPTARGANAIMRAFLAGWDDSRIETMMASNA